MLQAQHDAAERQRLLDQFAAAALTGLLAKPDDGSYDDAWHCRAAYSLADAMLAERESRRQKSTPTSRPPETRLSARG